MTYLILQGIVGSIAYGLSTPNSDVDRLAVYAEPTIKFHGLHIPVDKAASKVSTGPGGDDIAMHEVRKYCLLALQCNPTVMELMWLPDELYETRTYLGDELIAIRETFLSAKRVRDAYLGYATQQFKRLENREDGSFSSDTRKRTAKHARHLLRLCYQGLKLYSGEGLIVRLPPERATEFRSFGEAVAEGNIELARNVLANYEHGFDNTESPLPFQADETSANDWLLKVRKANFHVNFWSGT